MKFLKLLHSFIKLVYKTHLRRLLTWRVFQGEVNCCSTH